MPSTKPLFSEEEYRPPGWRPTTRQRKERNVDDILKLGGRSIVEGRGQYTVAYILRQLESNTNIPRSTLIDAVRERLKEIVKSPIDEDELRRKVEQRKFLEAEPLLQRVIDTLKAGNNLLSQEMAKKVSSVVDRHRQ